MYVAIVDLKRVYDWGLITYFLNELKYKLLHYC